MEEVSFPLFFLSSAFRGTTTTTTFPCLFLSSPFISCKSTPPLRLTCLPLGFTREDCGGRQECSIGCTGDSLSPTAPLGTCGGLWSPLFTLPALHRDCGGCSGRVQREFRWRWCATNPRLVVLWIFWLFTLLCLSYVVTLSILCRRPFVVSFALCVVWAPVFAFLSCIVSGGDGAAGGGRCSVVPGIPRPASGSSWGVGGGGD